MTLKLEAPDGFPADALYARLLALGKDRTDRDARRALAALVLLLSNHIGDEAVLNEAIGIVEDLPPLRDD